MAMDHTVHLTKQARTDITWVLGNLKKKIGRLGWKPSRVIPIYVDASTTGWSATLDQERAFRNWRNKYACTDIAQLESMAALLGLESFASTIAHHWVTIFIDNRVARKTVEAGGRRPWQKEIMREVWNFCNKYDVQVHEFLWVLSELNPADELTRLIDEMDWTLSQDLFEEINRKWGPFTIDCMATYHTRKVARFNSRYHCPEAEATDCFTQNWKNENNYVCPPLSLIQRVIEHGIEYHAQVTIIIPVWTSALWWPVLF